MSTKIKNVQIIDNTKIKVSGVRKLNPWEIEYQGSPYNCSACKNDKNNCCDSKNRPECEKCLSQMLHLGSNKTEKVPAYILNCKNCNYSKYSYDYSKTHGLLENEIIQPVVIYDCSQKSYIEGSNNDISNIQMVNACSGIKGDTTILESQLTNNKTEIMWLVGILSLLLGIGIFLFF